MGSAIDLSMTHFRMLNRQRGSAVWGPRGQADRKLYSESVKNILKKIKNLYFFEEMIDEIIMDNNTVCGVRTSKGGVYKSDKIVLTNGTFLRGLCSAGSDMTEGGRRGSEKSATALADCLKQFMTLGRLKTGTPPRLSIETINFKKLISQESEKPTCFSFVDNLRILPIKNPYQAYTNERTHDLVLKSVDSLPSSKNALIETKKLIAPRYCPSLLTKIERFPEKESHAIWLEPEGINSNLIYPGGLAGAFSPDIQQKIVQTIYGLEEAIVEAPGYDVEYDFIDSTKLHPTLESKHIRGLYFAGQICGTTGYEEAAALGLIAGLNAGLSVTSDRGFKR
eukprot:GHVL01038648.1.p1 GENE.GHVL01038648.1~~GHVL01038648.1.p1  ORF type:complete len:337 (-),score=80.00 GHVL01038648.1:792-1802(-)